MQFIRSDQVAASAALYNRLETELQAGKAVLWLVSGGSNIPITVGIMQALPAGLTKNLTIMPIDERYGEPGHPNSNWQQLLDAGFDPKEAATMPILQPYQSFAQARNYYEEQAARAFTDSGVVIAQMGMGADGHIAGILPHTAAVEEKDQVVTAYESSPYQRLTLTYPALRKISAAYTFAFGEGKRGALEQLKNQVLPLAEQPAQILKELPESYLYNDTIDD